jgi:hypothetical protein
VNLSVPLKLRRLPIILCLSLFVVHLIYLIKFGVDIPFLDEWNMVPGAWSWSWLFGWNNEHRHVLTKLVIWLLYHINGWNLKSNQILNLFLYGNLLIGIAWVMRQQMGPKGYFIGPWFIIFLLSPINYWAFSWGILSCIHFLMFFLLMSIIFLFRDSPTPFQLCGGGGCLILAAYSHAGGIVGGIVILLIFGLFWGYRWFSLSMERRFSLMILTVVVFMLFTIWFIGFKRPLHHPPLTFPNSLAFWNFYLNHISYGFGFDRVSWLIGLGCLLLVIVPIIATWSSNRKPFSIGQSPTMIFTIVLLVILASIAMGRAKFGALEAKTSHYSECGLMLIPMTVVNWWLFLREREQVRKIVVMAIWLLLGGSFLDNWRGFEMYRWMGARREAGLRCVSRYYFEGGEGNCPMIYWEPFPGQLEKAKSVRLSFYRRLLEQRKSSS